MIKVQLGQWTFVANLPVLLSATPTYEGDASSFGTDISGDGRYVAFQSEATNLVTGDTNFFSDIFVADTATGQVVRASVTSAGAQANSSSVGPSISADGRFVVFGSSATNLIAGDTNGNHDIFRKDMQTGAIVRVSEDGAGGQTNDTSATTDSAISGDGRFVVFESYATNLVSDSNAVRDIFRKDLATGAIARVSIDSVGTEANGQSIDASISRDGRFIVFSSAASNLITGDLNGQQDVFRKDTLTGEVLRVSTTSSNGESGGSSGGADISADGRYVVFGSGATDLVAGDTNGTDDIFRKDLLTGELIRVSTSSTGEESNGVNFDPEISADGRYVIFNSFASNLVTGDHNGSYDVFRKDMVTGEVVRLSVDNGGADNFVFANSPTISDNGTYAAFTGMPLVSIAMVSQAYRADVPTLQMNIAERQNRDVVLDVEAPGATDVTVDWGTGATSSATPVGNVASFNFGYTADGTYTITITSTHVGVETETLNAIVATEATDLTLVSSAPAGAPNGASDASAVSGNGRYVAFTSSASNLVSGDGNGAQDIFRKDLLTGNVVRVSQVNSAVEADNPSSSPDISFDGRYVVFESIATNLVAGDFNFNQDIFRKDLISGNLVRVSTNSSGQESNGDSYRPAISANGRFVVFESSADNLVTGDLNLTHDIFRKDLVTGQTLLVSQTSGGVQPDQTSSGADISADGRYVVFETFADNLVPGDANAAYDVFRKDLATGALELVSQSAGGIQGNALSNNASISADGRYVVFASDASNLVTDDTNTQSDIFRKDMMTGTVVRVSTTAAGGQSNGFSYNAEISGNGRYVTFESGATNLVAGDTNAVSDIFRKDLVTGEIVRVSMVAGTQQATQGSARPSISADGSVIAFDTHDNLLDGSGGSHNDFDVVAWRRSPVQFINGTEEADLVLGSRIRDEVSTSDGDDIIRVWGGNDRVLAGAGDDRITGGTGKDELFGGPGADTFIFLQIADTPTGAGRDIIGDWESGDDIDLAPIDANTTLAGNQDFTFRGLGSIDRTVAQGEMKFYQFGGNTYIVGNATADTEADFQIEILGTHDLTTDNFLGLRNAVLRGTAGNDTLLGTNGDDSLTGLGGKDNLFGRLGADTFVFTSAADTQAGANRDVIRDWQSIDEINLAAIDANASVAGNQDFTFIGLGPTNQTVAQGEVKFYHFGGNTYVVGNTTADTQADFQIEIIGTHDLTTDNLVGLSRAVLTGTAGNDVLRGTNGNDSLTGLGGKDTLFGRLGADTFVFTSTADTQAGANRDVIRDWQSVDDIDVELIDANTSVGGDQDFTFIGLGATNQTVGQGQIKYYQFGGNTYVVGNATPDTTADFQIEIIGTHTLTSSNFLGLV